MSLDRTHDLPFKGFEGKYIVEDYLYQRLVGRSRIVY